MNETSTAISVTPPTDSRKSWRISASQVVERLFENAHVQDADDVRR